MPIGAKPITTGSANSPSTGVSRSSAFRVVSWSVVRNQLSRSPISAFPIPALKSALHPQQSSLWPKPGKNKWFLRPGFGMALGRRAPKVTVTRDGVSLCQKGVTPWLLFVVNYFLASKRAKTSRGAGLRAPQHAPPCGRRRTRSHGGGTGGRSGEQSYSPWPLALRSIGFGCA